jgi:8-amino-7-oxononanoate synthase
MNFKNLYSDCLNELKKSGRYRQLIDFSSQEKLASKIGFIDFSSNDYLNLSRNQKLIAAAKLAAENYGVGSTGSRLLSGNNQLFSDFERQIAIDKKTDSSLIFNSGFQANVTVLAALLNKSVLGDQPLVFFDRYNHSSLYNGVFLSGAEMVRYNHNDLDHLSDLLKKYQNHQRPKFIVTETLHGMDGDIIDLATIVDLARQHQAFLYLDEAHATGILGDNGYGLSTTIDMGDISYLVMGTFSKALGSFGGWVAGDLEIKNYLINKCAGFIYSTSLSPAIIGASYQAWQMVKDFTTQRKSLLATAKKLRAEIKKLGFDTAKSSTHIIPIILKKDNLAIKARDKLLKEKIILSAIRSPTVAPNSARLRIALTVKHSDEDMQKLLSALKKL